MTTETRESTASLPQEPRRQPVRCALILNKDSGVLSELWSEEFETELINQLKQNGWAPELCLVSGSDIDATLEYAIKEKFDAIIAGGGDGTTTSIAGKLRGSEIPLGILPFGTLNLAARDLGTPLDPIEAVKALHPGQSRNIDVLEVNGRACLCLTIIGVYPELLNRSEEFHGSKWWIKFCKLSGLLATAYFRSPRFRIQLNMGSGKTKNVTTRFLLIVPGQYEDEFGLIPRRDQLSSGRCRIYISNHQSRWSNLRMALRFFAGRTKQDPDLQVETAETLELSVKGKQSVKASVDGELIDLTLPIRFDLKPHQLRVITPQTENQVETP